MNRASRINAHLVPRLASAGPETLRMVASSMKMAAASEIVDAALHCGHTHSMQPLTVVVLDAGGHTVVLKREDGSGIMRVDIAMGYEGLKYVSTL